MWRTILPIRYSLFLQALLIHSNKKAGPEQALAEIVPLRRSPFRTRFWRLNPYQA